MWPGAVVRPCLCARLALRTAYALEWRGGVRDDRFPWPENAVCAMDAVGKSKRAEPDGLRQCEMAGAATGIDGWPGDGGRMSERTL